MFFIALSVIKFQLVIKLFKLKIQRNITRKAQFLYISIINAWLRVGCNRYIPVFFCYPAVIRIYIKNYCQTFRNGIIKPVVEPENILNPCFNVILNTKLLNRIIIGGKVKIFANPRKHTVKLIACKVIFERLFKIDPAVNQVFFARIK